MHKLKQKSYSIKGYFHFDYPIHISKVESYVQNRNAIAEHSFFPLIAYNKELGRHTTNLEEYTDGRPFYKKNRPIKYAGHLDGYIYKYYANELNCIYNEWALKHKIDDCSVAYRNNKTGKCNIDFAAEVINFLYNIKNALVVVGDFKGYFESLNHQLLKERMGKVLKCERLSDDWFNVFNSITKYGYVEKIKVEEFFGNEDELRRNGFKTFVSKDKTVSDFRKKNKIHSNTSGKGIPQGVPISAVMANVYAIEFDELLNQAVTQLGGIYRRYSDDFIIIMPNDLKEQTIQKLNDLTNKVYQYAEENGLEIANEKTHIYKKENRKIYELVDDQVFKESKIDYLGFVYDGISVSIRQRSIERFYRKMKKFIKRMETTKRINNRRNDRPNLTKIPHRKLIYGLFTDRGFKKKNEAKRTNFIEYVKRSQFIFDKVSPETNNIMLDQIKNRKKKIEKLLGMRIYVKLTKK